MKAMRSGSKSASFPGTDVVESTRMAADVALDEERMIAKMNGLREVEGVSLEALAFVLATQSAQLSRHLKGRCNTYLLNYIRVARALGYRCEISFSKADCDTETDAVIRGRPTKSLRTKRTSRKLSIDDKPIT